MLKSTRGWSGWSHNDYKQYIDFEEERIIKQDESDGDSKFIATIGFGGKSSRP